MEIVIAKNSGLCYGVKRALNIARETRQKKTGNVYTLGDLIHNPQVIADLKQKGIQSVTDLEEFDQGWVIIRSHGVSPDIYRRLEKKNIKIVDATCPIVKKIQRLVEKLAREKKEIIIVGNKEHPEIPNPPKTFISLKKSWLLLSKKRKSWKSLTQYAIPLKPGRKRHLNWHPAWTPSS